MVVPALFQHPKKSGVPGGWYLHGVMGLYLILVHHAVRHVV